MKNCIKCGCELNSETTTWYRQKNYIHKCNDCIRKEKKEWAKNNYSSYTARRSKKSREKSRKENPKRYSCIQMKASAKKRAKSLGLDYDLTLDFMMSMAVDCCPILGLELSYGGGKKSNRSPSLDRKDSTKGYTVDNVWIVSNLANCMKSNASHEEIYKFSEWGLRTFEKIKGRAK